MRSSSGECIVEFGEEGSEALSSGGGVLGQGVVEYGAEVSWQRAEVGLIGEVSIDDFGGGFSLEGHVAGQQFVDDGRRAVDIDLGSIFSSRDFRGHVVDGPDALGLGSPLAGRDDLGESDVADLDVAGFAIEVLWLEVPMHDAPVVQVVDSAGESVEPRADLVDGHAVGVVFGEDLIERLAADVFHHDPGVSVVVFLDVDDGDEVGVLEVEALLGATAFDFDVAVQQFQCHLLAPVADRVVDLPESSSLDSPLDGESCQRS